MEIDSISPINFKRRLDILSPRENKRMRRDKKRRIEEKPTFILEQNKKRAIVLISPKKKRKRHCMLQKKSLQDMGPEFIEELKFLYYCQREDTSEEDTLSDEGERRKRCCILEEDEPLSLESEAYTRARNKKFAEKALECYNKENSTKFILADALDTNVIMLDAIWIHGNFTAKMDAESSPEIFFYEIYRSNQLPALLTVIVCLILKGENTIGCHLCSKVIHPTQGFCRGYHPPTKAEIWSVNQLVSKFAKALVLPSN